MELPIRTLYLHKTGKVFYANGIAKDENKKEVMVIVDVSNGSVHTRPLSMFLGTEAVFQLATPSVK